MIKQRFALIGKSLSHSWSPYIHKNLGLCDEYELIEIPDKEQFRKFIKTYSFGGLNITIPYKEEATLICDELSSEAAAIGVVNTIIRSKNEGLLGLNTDAAGFFDLLNYSGLSPCGKHCLILGRGASSKTAGYVLQKMGAASIEFVSRKGEINYQNAARLCSKTEFIVNTTPVGMYPQNDDSPVNLCDFPACSSVVDIVYNPVRTALLCQAEELRIPCAGGAYMLVSQAAHSAKYFYGKPADDFFADKIYRELLRKMNNIVLIGMPGCGKTFTGKKLAKNENRKFIDTDDITSGIYYEKYKELKSPAEIILEYGEEFFRGIESLAIKEAAKNNSCVIAAGGGTVLKKENTETLRRSGIIIFIDVPVSQLKTEDRPLSSGGIEKLNLLYEKRRSIYLSSADIVYRVQNGRYPEEAEILNLYNKFIFGI